MLHAKLHTSLKLHDVQTFENLNNTIVIRSIEVVLCYMDGEVLLIQSGSATQGLF